VFSGEKPTEPKKKRASLERDIGGHGKKNKGNGYTRGKKQQGPVKEKGNTEKLKLVRTGERKRVAQFLTRSDKARGRSSNRLGRGLQLSGKEEKNFLIPAPSRRSRSTKGRASRKTGYSSGRGSRANGSSKDMSEEGGNEVKKKKGRLRDEQYGECVGSKGHLVRYKKWHTGQGARDRTKGAGSGT